VWDSPNPTRDKAQMAIKTRMPTAIIIVCPQ
jgi:hypothetical protein